MTKVFCCFKNFGGQCEYREKDLHEVKETASQRTKTSLVLSEIYVQITTHETLNISYEGFVFPTTISDIVT